MIQLIKRRYDHEIAKCYLIIVTALHHRLVYPYLNYTKYVIIKTPCFLIHSNRSFY